MSKRSRAKRSIKAGLAPGTLVHIGDEAKVPTNLSLYRYSSDSFEEVQGCSIEEIAKARDLPGIKWIEVNGLHDSAIIQKIGELFKIHSLVLEDIVNTSQRPKRDDFGTLTFIVVKTIQREEKTLDPIFSQISFVLGTDFVISFEEHQKDCFDSLRTRLRNAQGKIRLLGADYLLYSLIDSIVDFYFLSLEDLGEKLEDIEEELIKTPVQSTLSRIYELKRSILLFRRAAWPLRELLSSITRGESLLIQKETLIYFRDIYDHAVEIIDIVENNRERIAGMIEIYLSSISNRLNEVMRVLTVITTIFMPLSFIAGVYGMNFRHMPELEWPYGYYYCLLLMLGLSVGMLIYFRSRKWL